MASAIARIADDGTVEFLPTRRGLMERLGLRKAASTPEYDALEKAVAKRVEAALQGAKVNDSLLLMGGYDAGELREPTGATFAKLRQFASACGVTAAIINRRMAQVAAFCDTPEMRFGQPRSPGFRIRMSMPEAQPNERDVANMRQLEQFIRETGFCAPPEEECPDTYQPGFEGFLRQFVRDSLTIDQVAVRTWPSATNPNKYPVVSFACIDAGLVRRAREHSAGLHNGVRRLEPYKGERTNAKGPVRWVKLACEGGMPEDEFTSEELSVGVRNMRTDEGANGYGYSEVEQAIDDITVWLFAREYNASRFRKDSLPRGMLLLLGKLDDAQVERFKAQWRLMLQGVANRWSVPILKADPASGSNMVWTPFDMSSRDMEYHQFTFAVALIMHAKFLIHPDETGFEALSPFRPPLSQGSPEAKLTYSQDMGLRPLVRFVQSFLNRRIIWRLYPDRRYKLEFCGLGDWDAAADVALWGQMLQSGLTTPRIVWGIMDQEIPEALKDHPAWDIPLPWAQGVQMMQQMEQYEMQQQQMQRQMAMQEEAARKQSDLQKMQSLMGGGDQGQDRVPSDRGDDEEGPEGMGGGEGMMKGVGWLWQ